MKVLIVGGGSAGWVTAAYMNAVLNDHGKNEVVEITLVESERIGRIGVGESTIPTIKKTLRTIGIPERDFMRATDATFKQAIRFVNWREIGDQYYHPFDRWSSRSNDPKALDWLRSDRSDPFAYTVSYQPGLVDKALSPKGLKYRDYESPLIYAYHLNAERFADCLRDFATPRGVKHIIGDVVDVECADVETIKSIKLEDGRTLEADLFIDCTGFARVLISKTLGAEFESLKQYLLCDSAVAFQVPYDLYKPDQIECRTTSTALSSGWVWNVPLQTRRGTGYVYSSEFISDEDAEAEFREFEGPHSADLKVGRFKFDTGRIKTPWKGNCIAIGLSAGFIEPLESTGIYMVEDAVDLLCEVFPIMGDPRHCRDTYNSVSRRRFLENIDFINMHYALTQRNDTPFWREVQREERMTPTLRKKLEVWNTKLPSRVDGEYIGNLYSYINYEYVLLGMGWTPESMKTPPPGAKAIDRSGLLANEQKATEFFLPQELFLERYLNSEPSPELEPRPRSLTGLMTGNG